MSLTNAFQQLSEFGWSNIILILLLAILFVCALIKGWTELLDVLGLEPKKKRIEREREEEIKEIKDRITTLEQSADKFNNDRIHDREQSFEIQQHWTDLINAMTEKQDQIIERVDALAEQNRKYELADIRETLLQAYRYYTGSVTNPLRMWTEMESHAFWEQYGVYEDHGGNSYMQSTVKPEMHKLIEIPMNDYEAIAELMESRHTHRN